MKIYIVILWLNAILNAIAYEYVNIIIVILSFD